MKIAIHFTHMYFSQGWIDYCENNQIDYQLVNCYDTDIIRQLKDCDALMWHHDHMDAKDTRFAKQLLFALEQSGKVVFPDFRSNWHFDDKLGQKYLLEAAGAPLVPSYAFYSKEDALKWAGQTTFPKVFKLRGGSGSDQVRLLKNKREAVRAIRIAFGRGYSQYSPWRNLRERWRKFRKGMTGLKDVLAGVARLFRTTRFSRVQGRIRGYFYAQDFIPDNTHDIRVTYVNGKVFALRRRVRPGDFRASGGGLIEFDVTNIPDKAIEIGFEFAKKLELQNGAFDFVMDGEQPLITEISYGFGYTEEQFLHGYWDEDLRFHPGPFDPYGWMVEGIIERIRNRETSDSN